MTGRTSKQRKQERLSILDTNQTSNFNTNPVSPALKPEPQHSSRLDDSYNQHSFLNLMQVNKSISSLGPDKSIRHGPSLNREPSSRARLSVVGNYLRDLNTKHNFNRSELFKPPKAVFRTAAGSPTRLSPRTHARQSLLPHLLPSEDVPPSKGQIQDDDDEHPKDGSSSSSRLQATPGLSQGRRKSGKVSFLPPLGKLDSLVKQQNLKQIVNACMMIERQSKRDRNLVLKYFDMEAVLDQIRLAKTSKMDSNFAEIDNCHNPDVLRQIYIHNDQIEQDYEVEARHVIKQYIAQSLNPLREVAKIELKNRSKAKRKKNKSMFP